jgi:hypothetical protein
MVKIKVHDYIRGGLDHEDGARVFDLIVKAFKNQEDTEVDFNNLEIVTSSFLNTSFRILAKEYEHDYIKKNLRIRNSNAFINTMIRRCFDEAITEKV